MKQKLIAVCSACGSPVEYDDGDEFAYCPMCENDQVEIRRRTYKPKTILEKYVPEAVTNYKIGDKVIVNDNGKNTLYIVSKISLNGTGVEFTEVQDLPELDFRHHIF